MTDETIDVSASLLCDSTQLNAADLMTGPVCVEIVRVKVSTSKDPKQPYDVYISGGFKPWRPCKTMRRLLVALWGPNAALWVGHWVRLYRDPSVRAPDGTVPGGTRMSGADIEATRDVEVPGGKGPPKVIRIEAIRPPASWLADLLAESGLTIADLDASRAEANPPKPPVASLSDDERNKLTAFYRRNPAKLPKVKK